MIFTMLYKVKYYLYTNLHNNINMIINFHPQERESKKGLEVISNLNKDTTHEVVHASAKTISEWQDIIKSNETLILVAPVYWWGASYEFDKWAQNVLSYGFAYRYTEDGTPEGLLNGRAFQLHMTHGTPLSYATKMLENIKERMSVGIFGFSNATVDIFFYEA